MINVESLGKSYRDFIIFLVIRKIKFLATVKQNREVLYSFALFGIIPCWGKYSRRQILSQWAYRWNYLRAKCPWERLQNKGRRCHLVTMLWNYSNVLCSPHLSTLLSLAAGNPRCWLQAGSAGDFSQGKDVLRVKVTQREMTLGLYLTDGGLVVWEVADLRFTAYDVTVRSLSPDDRQFLHQMRTWVGHTPIGLWVKVWSNVGNVGRGQRLVVIVLMASKTVVVAFTITYWPL